MARPGSDGCKDTRDLKSLVYEIDYDGQHFVKRFILLLVLERFVLLLDLDFSLCMWIKLWMYISVLWRSDKTSILLRWPTSGSWEPGALHLSSIL